MGFGGEGTSPAQCGFGAMPEAEKKQGQCSCGEEKEHGHKDCACQKKGGGNCGNNCGCKNK